MTEPMTNIRPRDLVRCDWPGDYPGPWWETPIRAGEIYRVKQVGYPTDDVNEDTYMAIWLEGVNQSPPLRAEQFTKVDGDKIKLFPRIKLVEGAK